MYIKVDGHNYDGLEERKAVSVSIWYDRHTRCWVAQVFDSDGYQIDNAVYVYTKKEAIEARDELEKLYGIA